MKYQAYITAKLNNDMANDEATAQAVYKALKRFNSGDWGNVPQEDKDANNADLTRREGRVLARYDTPNGDIYINLSFEESGEDTALLMYCNEY